VILASDGAPTDCSPVDDRGPNGARARGQARALTWGEGPSPQRGDPRRPERKLVAITSAFVDSGWAYETDRDRFGRADADTLVLSGATDRFNPNVDPAWLERERRKAPQPCESPA
jgi:hypothetical protein